MGKCTNVCMDFTVMFSMCLDSLTGGVSFGRADCSGKAFWGFLQLLFASFCMTFPTLTTFPSAAERILKTELARRSVVQRHLHCTLISESFPNCILLPMALKLWWSVLCTETSPQGWFLPWWCKDNVEKRVSSMVFPGSGLVPGGLLNDVLHVFCYCVYFSSGRNSQFGTN